MQIGWCVCDFLCVNRKIKTEKTQAPSQTKSYDTISFIRLRQSKQTSVKKTESNQVENSNLPDRMRNASAGAPEAFNASSI